MELDELKRALDATDPSAVLVAPRILRRVIQAEFNVPYMLVQVPHQRCYAFDRQAVFRSVEQDELELEPDRLLPSTVVLLARPSPEELESRKQDAILSKYWRLLFHAQVHVALERRHQEGRLTLSDVHERIEQIGRTEFEEIRSVLEQENCLLLPHDDVSVFIEFAAVYLELRYFRTAGSNAADQATRHRGGRLVTSELKLWPFLKEDKPNCILPEASLTFAATPEAG